MAEYNLDSGSVAGMTSEVVQNILENKCIISYRKADIFMLLESGHFHFALTVIF